jgi:hypothetical protein
MTVRDITPEHLRCASGLCPDVFPQDNGDILVIGRIAMAEEVAASGGNVGEGEVALVIAEGYFEKLPVVAELRARIAKLEGEESFPEVKSFSPEAVEKMREYARNADVLNAQRLVDLGCQAGAEPEEAAHRPSASSSERRVDAEEIVTSVMNECSVNMHKCFATGKDAMAEAFRLRLEGAARVAQKLGMLRPDEEPCKGDTASQPVGQ